MRLEVLPLFALCAACGRVFVGEADLEFSFDADEVQPAWRLYRCEADHLNGEGSEIDNPKIRSTAVKLFAEGGNDGARVQLAVIGEEPERVEIDELAAAAPDDLDVSFHFVLATGETASGLRSSGNGILARVSSAHDSHLDAVYDLLAYHLLLVGWGNATGHVGCLQAPGQPSLTLVDASTPIEELSAR